MADLERNKQDEVMSLSAVSSLPRTETLKPTKTRVGIELPYTQTHHSRIPIEYRTLSIHVYDSQRFEADAARAKDETDADFFGRLDFHVVPANTLAQRLNVSSEAGLDTSAATKRFQRNGPNTLSKQKTQYWKKLLRYLFGDFCSVLWIGVIVFFISWKPLGDPPQVYNLALAIVVIIVILLQAAFSALQDWSSQKVMNSILNLVPENANVIRDGVSQSIPSSQLVLGDVINLSIGDRVPADIRIIKASPDLRFDRSILTGEADEVAGTVNTDETNFLEAKNIALLGTHVCNGTATGIVVLTGAKTVMGRINKLTTSGKDGRTNLQREITRFTYIIIGLTLTLIIIMLITWLAWLRKDHGDYLPVSPFLTDLIGLVVAFIPEGMPIAVALTLSLVARRMRDANILPKSLSTVEMLGCVNVICSDKTGTLTENRMSVASIGFIDDNASLGDLSKISAHPSYNPLRTCMAVCNDANFESFEDDINVRKIQGNATDAACLRFVFDVKEPDHQRVFDLPFNSRNKYMMTVVRVQTTYIMMLKGAPDVLLPHCSRYINKDGKEADLDEKAKAQLIKTQEEWSSQGQRVIMVAQRDFAPRSKLFTTDFEEEAKESIDNLTILGLIGIVDPPRHDTAQTVAECRRAGSRFFMVTGDFSLTAGSIASQVGILTNRPDRLDAITSYEAEDGKYINRSLIVEGKEIPSISSEQWDKLCLYEEIVFARTTPEQKLKIVEQLRIRNFVVAVTGDGVNDAPALKAADVGIAMASGSEVAMEAADLILLGDFASVVQGIRLGRLVFQNLQKAISYLLPAGSYSEDWPVILNVFFGCPLPLSSFLMIIICCFTDLACCLTLVFEKEEFDLLSLPPRNPKQSHLVGAKIYGQSYLFMGTMETITAHSMFFYYMYTHAGIPISKLFFAFANYSDGYYGHTQDELNHYLAVGQSVYFVTLVVLQIANLNSVRNKRLSILQRGPQHNYWVMLGPVLSIIIAIFVTEVPGIQNLFGTGSVPIKFWFIPVPLAVGLLMMDEIRKLLVRVFPRGPIAKIAW